MTATPEASVSIDFQQVREQVKKLGENAPQRARQFEAMRREAGSVLADVARSGRLLLERVEAAVQFNPRLRSALPGDEALDEGFPLPNLPEKASLLAADGSQIFPDRHGSVYYSLINVGAICMARGEARAPSQTIRSRLLYDEQMYTENGRITERLVALMRDLGERTMLAELADGLETPILTLTDGPLELWDSGGPGEQAVFEKYFDEYLDALRALQQQGASTAGYIDKPGSDLVVRLLEIANLPLADLQQAGRERPFRGLTDVELLSPFLEPGERSAVFGIQSPTANRYSGDLALHFFYLNVAPRGAERPYLARVEIPSWVAADRGTVDDVHALLIEQSRILGARPYPYMLHRSHEVAVVSRDEKQQVEAMIELELMRQGLEVGPASYKSSAKQAGKRT